jgi:hypothetical protein
MNHYMTPYGLSLDISDSPNKKKIHQTSNFNQGSVVELVIKLTR